jgi:hypothetical protein
VEKSSILESLNADHFLTQGFRAGIKQIYQANQLQERLLETPPMSSQLMTQAEVCNVNKEILSKKTKEETVGRRRPGEAIFAQHNGIKQSKCFPVSHRDLDDLAGRRSA